MKVNRREFLSAAIGAAAAPLIADADKTKLVAKADSVIHIWLPGGMAQTDMWDPKKFTPYTPGMKGSELLGTCPSIPTAADGIWLGKGLENIASVMHNGTILRTLSSDTKFGAVHLKAQYYANTGYLFASSVKAPSIGAIVGRTLGRRNAHVPSYIYIGRGVDTSDEEKLFISEYIGPGFYGVNYAPFMIPEPARGTASLESKAVMADARGMMDSPVQRAFDFRKNEKPETVRAYELEIRADQFPGKAYYDGNRFGHGLLLARRLVEAGARFIQVEYRYGPFQGFDMHEDGQQRMVEMKKQIDRPIAQLIRDLDERGLLDRTLVVIASEFGRTIASGPAAGKGPDRFAERNTGDKLVIENEKMYGFHGHFSSCSSMLFFGGGFKQGFVYGKTAAQHPMEPVENPVTLIDAYATIFKTLGFAPDTNYVTQGRPFYVTNDGKGKPVEALLV